MAFLFVVFIALGISQCLSAPTDNTTTNIDQCANATVLKSNQKEVWDRCQHVVDPLKRKDIFDSHDEKGILCIMYQHNLLNYCKTNQTKYLTLTEIKQYNYTLGSVCKSIVNSSKSIFPTFQENVCKKICLSWGSDLEPECLFAHYYFLQSNNVTEKPVKSVSGSQAPSGKDNPLKEEHSPAIESQDPKLTGKNGPENKDTAADNEKDKSNPGPADNSGNDKNNPGPADKTGINDPSNPGPAVHNGKEPTNPNIAVHNAKGKNGLDTADTNNAGDNGKDTDKNGPETADTNNAGDNGKGENGPDTIDTAGDSGKEQQVVELQNANGGAPPVNDVKQPKTEGKKKTATISSKSSTPSLPKENQEQPPADTNNAPQPPEEMDDDDGDVGLHEGDYPVDDEAPVAAAKKENGKEEAKPVERKPDTTVQEISPVNDDNLDVVDGESPFFSYFMVICVVFVLGYVAYHNRIKVMALLLEGKRNKRQHRGRRPNSANYHKLDSNLEEAISSNVTKNSSNVIY